MKLFLSRQPNEEHHYFLPEYFILEDLKMKICCVPNTIQRNLSQLFKANRSFVVADCQGEYGEIE